MLDPPQKGPADLAALWDLTLAEAEQICHVFAAQRHNHITGWTAFETQRFALVSHGGQQPWEEEPIPP